MTVIKTHEQFLKTTDQIREILNNINNRTPFGAYAFFVIGLLVMGGSIAATALLLHSLPLGLIFAALFLIALGLFTSFFSLIFIVDPKYQACGPDRQTVLKYLYLLNDHNSSNEEIQRYSGEIAKSLYGCFDFAIQLSQGNYKSEDKEIFKQLISSILVATSYLQTENYLLFMESSKKSSSPQQSLQIRNTEPSAPPLELVN